MSIIKSKSSNRFIFLNPANNESELTVKEVAKIGVKTCQNKKGQEHHPSSMISSNPKERYFASILSLKNVPDLRISFERAEVQ